MRPPQLILLLLCFILLPLLLTSLSLRSAHQERASATDSPYSNRVSRLRALFSFHAPSSLFPPSAIISLTDDNSTFFLARPAAFGPLLPNSGLSGQLWIGSGFGDDAGKKAGVVIGAEGELGCSDIPGWEDGNEGQQIGYGTQPDDDDLKASNAQPKPALDVGPDDALPKKAPGASNKLGDSGKHVPSPNDGTDDHLYRPKSSFNDIDSLRQNLHGNKNGGGDKNKPVPEHADIQSLQETAEITGKVVLLSRGGCGFLEKVKWAQRRGGTALIVGDNTRGGTLISMYAYGDTSNVTIPAVFTSHTTAHLLSSLIPSEKQPKDEKSEKSKKEAIHTEKLRMKRSSNIPDSAPLNKPASKQNPMSAAPGVFKSILSILGLRRDTVRSWNPVEGGSRPPSSGNIHWPADNQRAVNEGSSKHTRIPTGQETNGVSPSVQPKSDSQKGNEDNFIIGVQDWRDPDLVDNAKTSSTASLLSTPLPTASRKGSNAHPSPASNGLDGGSITPGSGEYISHDKASTNKRQSSDSHLSEPDSSDNGALKEGGKSSDRDGSVARGGGKETSNQDTGSNTPPAHKSPSKRATDTRAHEGLWVTITPTSISTSPFFDTLLVLVVSPLITLTVVYALLLIRSRIRRRRWRAPKAIVDRLPIRTYHTMQSNSTPFTPPQTATPRASSPSSPLLSRPEPSIPYVRSIAPTPQHSVAGSPNQAETGASYGTEKSASGSSLWRRKYTGRQIECVVCLEEYIDGQSRVMSLPCGHEFHAECITPWLTTRRRTCPICKGDVVRSLGNRNSGSVSGSHDNTADEMQSRIAEARNDSPSSAIPIPEAGPVIDPDVERGVDAPLPSTSNTAETQSGWRNFAPLNLSMLSGDTIWRQSRHGRPDRDR